jgi:hypothetical protein|nr:MAG TPA: hypothetical protein [Caudoviricetes sp.]
MKTVKLYMDGKSKNADGSEAEYVEVEEDQKYALYALGWKTSENELLPDD